MLVKRTCVSPEHSIPESIHVGRVPALRASMLAKMKFVLPERTVTESIHAGQDNSVTRAYDSALVTSSALRLWSFVFFRVQAEGLRV